MVSVALLSINTIAVYKFYFSSIHKTKSNLSSLLNVTVSYSVLNMQYDLTKNIYSALSVHALHLPGKRVYVQNDKDFAKAREELKECMKDYRIFLL